MKKIMVLVVVSIVLLGLGGTYFHAHAALFSEACIYGTAVNGDGSKIDGSARISTSWNGKEAYPRNGRYRLCLGSNPKQKITIYLDGSKYTTLYVNGDTELNIVRR